MEEQVIYKPHPKALVWILSILAVLAALITAAWFVVFRVNRFALSVQLAGEDRINLEYGTHYKEPGAEVVLSGTLFWEEGIPLEGVGYQISGQVEESTLGRYILNYTADYYWLHGESQRTVYVIDTQCPVITLVQDTQENLIPGTAYREAGFAATDNYDGDITDKVVITEELGLIFYAVVDSSGNPAAARREVPYHDPVAPEITLAGGEDFTISVGDVYIEPGYSAKDNLDGELTAQVAVEGDVDWLTPGIYPITYAVSDAYGNMTTVTRNVEVAAQERPDTIYPGEKTIYLTFDDGPGWYTLELLDVLDKYGVKATFFVVDTGCDGVMKKIVDRGHSIGIHSVSHSYEEIYASPEAFFDDLYHMQDIIYENTGVKTTLMRFPGGSSNTISCGISEGIMTTLSEAVQDAGFQYFDWNVYSGDAGETKKTREVVRNVTDGICQVDLAMVLQHDIHDYSVAAVEEIILWGLDNGYSFKSITENTPGFHHDINN